MAAAGAQGFFGALARGVKFDSQRIQNAKQHFKKPSDTSSASVTAAQRAQAASELDFFGFDAKQSKPASSKRERKISVDMVPAWAGGDAGEDETENSKTKKKKKKKSGGSMPRRKRKLSEGAIEEEKLVDEERRQASMLLTPKGEAVTKTKSKTRKRKKRSQSMGSEAATDDEEPEQQAPVKIADESADEESEEEEQEDAALFKTSDTSSKKPKKTKKQTQRDAQSDRDKEALRVFRKQMHIRVDGRHVPPPIATFSAMKLSPQQAPLRKILLANIEASAYTEPTPIQMQAIPSLLQRRDVLATAPTGSGKTAAFAIPMLANLGAPTHQGIRAIVLAPTRELAVQIHHEFVRLCAGRKFNIVLLTKATAATMLAQRKHHCTVNHDLVIATPLRLVHLLQPQDDDETQKLDLSMVEMVCLDEADRLFDMGFVEQIDDVLAACSNPHVQRMMFSATMLQGVEEMAQSVLRDPIQISIGVKNAGAATIAQTLVFVGKEEGKLVAMKNLMTDGLHVPALLFVQNKERANELYHELLYDGLNVGTVHADRTKEQRDETMRQFRSGQIWVLICTDLMSRGMDFKAVNMVINYDFPQDAVSYIHRIGRTGRGGRAGHAVTFFTEDDMLYLRSIANVMKLSGCDVPDWMLKLKKASAERRKKLVKAPLVRRRISTVSGYDLQKQHKRQLTATKHKAPSTVRE